MPVPRLPRLEFQIMDVLWAKGDSSIREIQEGFPAARRPAYTTIQTTLYRMESKEVVRRVKKVGNFYIFSAVVTRDAVHRRLVDDLLAFFGGRTRTFMAHLVESGKLSLEDIKEAERVLRELESEENQS
jgi:BlaI family transcriptional regulator, penicillinase repressor